MMAKVVDNEYTRKVMPQLLGKTFVCKFWSTEDEDSIWVDCIEDPKLSGYVNYLFLDSWSIK